MSPRLRETVFKLRHQEKQRILLRALYAYQPPDESPEESRAITEMIVRLETVLDRRSRSHRLKSGPQ